MADTTTVKKYVSKYTGEQYDESIGKVLAGGTIPTGGTTGQMLVKASDEDLDVMWADVPTGGGRRGGGLVLVNVEEVVEIEANIETLEGSV